MEAIEVVFSHDSVDAHDRGDYWREMTRPVFDIVALDGLRANTAVGDLRSRANGELFLGRTTFSSQKFTRSQRKVQVSGLDGYILQFLTSGEMRGNVGKEYLQLGPGDIWILDLSRTCENQASSGARLTMMIERDRLEKLMGRPDLHGQVFRRRQPVTRILFDYMVELWSVSLDITPGAASLSIDVVGNLLRGGQSDRLRLSPEEELNFLETIRGRILRFVDQQLEDPNLSVEMIADRFCISKSSLYRAMEMDGGVATVVRERRLAKAFSLLVRGDMKIAQVAYACGFSNSQQFFKAFHRKFGFPPSEARYANARNIIAPNLGDLLSHFERSAPRSL
ncbi:AraC type helix-turn-helix- domain-containing protein [Pandoraea anapnoica]|uniref:AraC type helix-turn-helix- domain-containing protein n=1 Tax=Pandoraea anapnoica TaxID=2508301 RepID=A0A5E5ANG0_9BURK|nr:MULTISPECIES: helix-turn-helix domain-containing protein [Pandoraea]VVE58344.1 AraC type helix-turn-helix- domain-containing protein [Pandoraea iniqua]VVE75239.1 AraC type helix-turn-helix- domain-containing protein [Pandoraea anapnoica]